MAGKLSGLRWYKASVVCCVGMHKGRTFSRDVIGVNMTEAQGKMRAALGDNYRLTGLHYAGTAEEYYIQLEADMDGRSDSVSD